MDNYTCKINCEETRLNEICILELYQEEHLILSQRIPKKALTVLGDLTGLAIFIYGEKCLQIHEGIFSIISKDDSSNIHIKVTDSLRHAFSKMNEFFLDATITNYDVDVTQFHEIRFTKKRKFNNQIKY